MGTCIQNLAYIEKHEIDVTTHTAFTLISSSHSKTFFQRKALETTITHTQN